MIQVFESLIFILAILITFVFSCVRLLESNARTGGEDEKDGKKMTKMLMMMFYRIIIPCRRKRSLTCSFLISG